MSSVSLKPIIHYSTDYYENTKEKLPESTTTDGRSLSKYVKVFSLTLTSNIALVAFSTIAQTSEIHAKQKQASAEIIETILNSTESPRSLGLNRNSYANEIPNLYSIDGSRVLNNSSHSSYTELITETVGYSYLNNVIPIKYDDRQKISVTKVEEYKMIEEKIKSTYNIATISLSIVACISLLSVLGLKFIPSPIDTTLLLTTAAGALGFFIDNLKREKKDAGIKTI